MEDYTPYPDAAVLGAYVKAAPPLHYCNNATRYNKTVEEPFGKLLRLPTVFVNVSDVGAADYDWAIL